MCLALTTFISLVYDVYKVICQQFKLTPTLSELSQVKSGEYDVGMVDINYSFELPSRADVKVFIRALESNDSTWHKTPDERTDTLLW